MKRTCIGLAAVLLLLSSAVLAQSAPPSADTYSSSAHNTTGTNYGSAILLVVQTGGNNAYLQFNLKTVPTGSTVNKATLRLFVDALVANGSFDVYQLNKSWSESTLTFSNAPALGASATGGHPVAVNQVNQFVLVDITSLVQGWQNGTIANNGIALATTTSTGSFSFDSKESVFTSHQPELEIVLNAPAGATGPQGPQGPQGLTGNTGAIGPIGPKGDTGSAGATGSQGPQGTTGNTGAAGPIGPTGATGLMGANGATGAVGPQGSTGNTGPQGPVGSTGATGAQGSMGLTGVQGPAGTNGTDGTNGTGFKFRNVFDNSATYAAYDVVTYNGSTYNATVAIPAGGATPDSNPSWTLMAQAGAAGATGSQGNTGALGPQGPQGNPGNTGATGPSGPTGAPGNTGAVGPVGPIGLTGSTGATGATGAQGSMGLPGAQGPPGTNGTNGSGFNVRGPFVLNINAGYNLNDVVTDTNGSSYVAIQINAGATDPASDSSNWTLMAQAGTNGTNGAPGANGTNGAPGTPGTNGTNGTNGAPGAPGIDGATGPAGPIGPQGATGDANARMIFPSFYPGNLTGTWMGGQFTLDQAITVLRVAAVAKTATGAACPAAVFRLTNGTKGQDLVLTPGQNWSDTGAMVMTFAAGDVLQASLRTGSTCASNTGADANLLVEYKMQATGDTDACVGTSCSGSCTTTATDPSNCGACGTTCPSGAACSNGTCPAACGAGQTYCNGACASTGSDPNNCGQCSNVCTKGTICASGQCTAPLPNGAACVAASQCLSNTCTAGFCVAPACGPLQTLCNGVCESLETDPNNCGSCGNVCRTNNDTASCQQGICAIQSCNPGFADCNQNPADGCEVNLNNNALNCGVCGNACISGQTCNNGACVGQPVGGPCSNNVACASNACDFLTSKCVSSLCVDQRQDGAETDIDCGGGTCGTCAVGKGCKANTDCSANACDFVSGTCASTQCTDQRKDGAETDIDCGGGTCATCANGNHCGVNSDCASNACDAASLLCVASQCTDHRKDGLETDIDCGGGICGACNVGLACQLDRDCASNACDATSFTCVTSQCFDHQKDGTETDVDCGGGSCSACNVGQHCLANSDCGFGHVCNGSHVCQ